MTRDGRRKVLVTGGGGFLGAAITKRLVERGDRVRSFSRRPHPELLKLGVEQIQGDVGAPESVMRACDGMDLVFHVAAKAGVWGAYADYYRVNVAGTLNVIQACRSQGVPRLVYTSSPSVVFNGADMEGVDEATPYPEHYHAHYPETKALAEQAVRAATDHILHTVILRPHLIWGPGDNHLVPRIIKRAKRLVRVGDGCNLVDTIYIDNAAAVHILAADKLETEPRLSGRIYFVSQGRPVPLWNMINWILAAAGLDPVKRSMSRQTAWWLGAVLERIYATLHINRFEPPMTRFVAQELATSHWFDISAARRDLGYSPRVSQEEGLRRLQHWLQTEDLRGV